MGGSVLMVKWATAGMVFRADHVHFTGAGYRMLGDAVFRDPASQYDIFRRLANRLWWHEADFHGEEVATELYCPRCQQPVQDPLTCGAIVYP